MAEKKAENAQAVQVAQKAVETFEAAEIAANAPRLFGYSIDIATAALDFNGIKRCTLDDAAKIIKAFAERKVN